VRILRRNATGPPMLQRRVNGPAANLEGNPQQRFKAGRDESQNLSGGNQEAQEFKETGLIFARLHLQRWKHHGLRLLFVAPQHLETLAILGRAPDAVLISDGLRE
jgi:hypothetical protein